MLDFILLDFMLKIAVVSVILFIIAYGLYSIYLWSRTKPKGAFILLAILPLMSVFPIPPPAFKNMETVEKKQHKRKEDSGDPPDELSL
ncbi:MAG: hypothetical protein ACI9IA_002287 [Enterobacterales bacterium]|jgi:hypothetical protein